MPTQPWLLPYVNPLKRQFGEDFLKKIPERPGVYLMLGDAGRVLYVGKAKSLRTRIASYSRAKPHDVSRKVIRMLGAVREIRIEECPSETEALLRENYLLRTVQPPFNVQNTRPDLYFLVGLRVSESSEITLRLTTRLEPQEGEELYGAFKGRGLTRRGYSALLRLLWVSQSELPARFEFPMALCRDEPQPLYRLSLRDNEFRALIERFLSGTSRALLSTLSERILMLERIPPFFRKWIQDDLVALDEFFQSGPRRNRKLRRHYGIEGKLIAQEKIDDLLVSYSQEKKKCD